MRLHSLRLLAAPGLDREIHLPEVGPGLVLLQGPNASGKSTLGRAMHGSLWPPYAERGVKAVAQWQEGGQTWASDMSQQRVAWEDDAPQPAAAAADAWLLSVAELLRADGQTDRAIADEIERALAGGYRIDKALRPFAVSPNAPTGLRNRLQKAQQMRREASDRTAELLRQEQELAVVSGRQRDARAAAADLQLAQKAQQALQTQADIAGVEAQLHDMPAGMAALHGDELDRLGEHQQAMEAARREIAEIERKAHGLDQTINGLRFHDATPTEPETHAWRKRARRLAALQEEGSQSQALSARATAAEAEARRRILSDDDVGEAPSQAALDAIEGATARRRELRDQVAASQQLVDAIPTSEGAVDPEPLRQAMGALRAWLDVGGMDDGGTGDTWVLPAGLAALLFVGLGLWFDLGWPSWLGLALLALVLVVVAWKRRVLRQASQAERQTHERQFQRLGVAPPASWQVDDVQARLASLQVELDRCRDASLWSEQRRAHQAALARVQVELEEAAVDVAQLARDHGLQPEWPDLILLQQASRSRDLDRARRDAVDADAALGQATTAWVEALGRLNAWLLSLGLAEVDDAAGAAASTDAIQQRLADVAQARKSLDETQEQRTCAKGRLEEAARKLSSLYKRCSVEDGDENRLRANLDLRAAWQELTQRRRDLQGALVSTTASLAASPHWLALDEPGVAAQIETLAASAARFEELTSDVAAMEQELKSAAEGTQLADARQELFAAEAALAETRQRALEDALGRMLGGWLRNQVQREHTPAVLARARALLLDFTRKAFDLEVDQEAGFVAVDVNAGRRRQLLQLSDGTRMQLLLAARIAFLEQAEGAGPKLPLFLDEALSTTDPVRFDAIGGALLDLVREGRQIIYATADPSEVQQWLALCERRGVEPPQVIDVAKATVQSAWHEAQPVAPAAPQPPPAVRDHDARSYAAALGLAPPGPRDPVGRWHILHLLHDDLAAVRLLVADGLDTVGQFRAFRAGGAVPLPMDEATAGRLAARAGLLEAVLELRLVGRHKPVTWAQVQASGAVTGTFRARMRGLLDSHGDDAARYLLAVAEIRNFRGKSRLALADYLAAQGLIADRAPLERDEIVHRAATRMADPIAAGLLGLPEIRAMVDWVEAVLLPRSR